MGRANGTRHITPGTVGSAGRRNSAATPATGLTTTFTAMRDALNSGDIETARTRARELSAEMLPEIAQDRAIQRSLADMAVAHRLQPSREGYPTPDETLVARALDGARESTTAEFLRWQPDWTAEDFPRRGRAVATRHLIDSAAAAIPGMLAERSEDIMSQLQAYPHDARVRETMERFDIDPEALAASMDEREWRLVLAEANRHRTENYFSSTDAFSFMAGFDRYLRFSVLPRQRAAQPVAA